MLDLLPWTIKKPGEKEKRRIERGLQVKGTGVGEKVKGKHWERTLKGRLEMRRRAMLEMPQLIQEWKQVSEKLCLGGGEYERRANFCVERSWQGMEEVAEWEGEEIDTWVRIWNGVRKPIGSGLVLFFREARLVYFTCTGRIEQHTVFGALALNRAVLYNTKETHLHIPLHVDPFGNISAL